MYCPEVESIWCSTQREKDDQAGTCMPSGGVNVVHVLSHTSMCSVCCCGDSSMHSGCCCWTNWLCSCQGKLTLTGTCPYKVVQPNRLRFTGCVLPCLLSNTPYALAC